MSRWFRIDDDVIHDVKVQALPGDIFKAWINVLCIASKNGGRLPRLHAVAFALRQDEATAFETLNKLRKLELLDVSADGVFTPHNWEGRQFITDGQDTSSAGRSKRWRDKKKAEDQRVSRGVIPNASGDATTPIADAVSPTRVANVSPTQDAAVSVTSPRVIDRDRTDTEPEAQAYQTRAARQSALAFEDGWPPDYLEQFWSMYPNKTGKKNALAKLEEARQSGAPWQDVIIGLERYIRDKPIDRKWMNPESFICGERWNDQITED